MKAVLKIIDIFGIPFQLKTMKKKKFKTSLGGCLTLLCVLLISFFSIFFGEDFYNKTNPNVIVSEKVYKSANKIDMAQTNFEFLFRIEDQKGIFLEPETLPLSIYTFYNFLEKDASGTLKYKYGGSAFAKRCSETRAVSNSAFESIDLKQWLCVDWQTLLKDTREVSKDPKTTLLFGGLSEEFDQGRIRIVIGNAKFNEKFEFIGRIPVKEITEWSLKHTPALVLRYPNAIVDSDSFENPLNDVYKQDRFLLRPETYRREERIMKRINLKDDKGVVLPSYETKTSFKQDSVTSEFLGNNLLTENSSVALFQGYIYLSNMETDVRRRFMKIQDLFAVVGGVMKIFFSSFMAIASGYAFYYRTIDLIKLLYGLNEEQVKMHNVIPEVEISSNAEESVNNYVQSKEMKRNSRTEKGLSIGIFSYYFRGYCDKSAEFKESLKVLKAASNYLDERLDLEFLLRHYEKFNDLVNLVLSEEQKEQLESKSNRVINKQLL